MVRKKRENTLKDAQIAPRTSPLQSELPGAFYRPWHAFQGLVHLQGVRAALFVMLGQARLTLAISSSCIFF